MRSTFKIGPDFALDMSSYSQNISEFLISIHPLLLCRHVCVCMCDRQKGTQGREECVYGCFFKLLLLYLNIYSNIFV